jgi:hypothetical protein
VLVAAGRFRRVDTLVAYMQQGHTAGILRGDAADVPADTQGQALALLLAQPGDRNPLQ